MALTHDHAHGHEAHGHVHPPADSGSERRLRIAFTLTTTILVFEAIGAWLSGSVALLADAGHMLTDAGALGVALFAARLSQKPHTASKSFGYGRLEILAALFNGMLLGGVSVGIALESIERLTTSAKPEIDAPLMFGVAVVGLIANAISAAILSHGAHDNLNVRGAFLHVLGDLLGSIAAIFAAACIYFWDFAMADALVGLLIAGLLVYSAIRLVRESAHILLEGAPGHLDLNEIAARVGEIQGVQSIHDLHIWTVTSGFLSMSAHIDLEAGADAESVRRVVHQLLHQEYRIHHTTIQTEQGPGLINIERPPDR
ncbi:MAG: cation transporter [bacterium]|nr:cation transporter [bacterium]